MGTAQTSWILRLIDKVTAPAKAIQSQIGAVTSHFDKLTSNVKRYEQQSDRLKSRLTGIAVGVASFAALSYGSVQFEQGMARANTMAGQSKKEFGALTDQVRDLANVVPLARTELSDGLYSVLSADVQKDNWIQVLTDSSKAAYGANAKLSTVIGSTATVVKAYNKSWKEASSIQDKFAKTVALGQINSLEDLASNLPKVAGLANQLGVSVDEMLGVFSTFAGVTGSTSEAATQLNAIFSALMNPSSQAVEMSQKLNFRFDAESIQKAGGVKVFFEQLNKKVLRYSKKTGRTTESIYGSLFGSVEALKTVIPLVNGQLGTFDAKVKKIAQSSGTVNQMFGIMAETTASKIQLMRNKFGNVMDGIVQVMTPLVVIILDSIGGVLEMVQSFMKANPILSKFIILGIAGATGIYAIVTALAFAKVQALLFGGRISFAATALKNDIIPALRNATIKMWAFIRPLALAGWNAIKAAGSFIFMGVSALATFIGSMVAATAAQWGLNIAMYANPIGLVILAIAALIGLVVIIIKKYDEWGAALTLLLGPFGMVINVVMALKRHWESIKNAFSTGGMIAGIKRIGVVIIDALLMPIQQLMEWLSKVPGLGKLAASGVEMIQKVRTKLDLAEPEEKVLDNKGLEKKESIRDIISQKTNFNPNSLNPKEKGNGLNVQGTGASGNKSLVMNLDIRNNFDVRDKTDIDNIVDILMEKLVDRMRDAAIQFG